MALDRQKAAQFRNACAAFDITNSHAINSLSNVLEQLTTDLAKSEILRQRMGKVEPPVWPDLQKLWKAIADTQVTSRRSSWDGDEGSLRRFTVVLSKFTRNIVAGVHYNQEQVYQAELEIRRLLHHHTSWISMKDPQSAFKVTQALVQALSNVVTTNEALMMKIWETYLNLPEEQVILMCGYGACLAKTLTLIALYQDRRLLASPDPRTVLSVLIFMVNCTHQSEQRSKKLCTSPIGARICISSLDRMVNLYDATESSDGGKAFDAGYGLFTRLFEGGFTSDLYTKLYVPGEVITPHQITLLKLLDSYLQSSEETKIHEKLCTMLSGTFFTLTTYAQQAIRQALGPRASDGPSSPFPEAVNVEVHLEAVEPLQELDMLLPKVCEALVLVTQCIITITLEEEDTGGNMWADDTVGVLKVVFNDARSEGGDGLVESLLELLRLLDIFLPRIHFGKPVQSSSKAQKPHDAAADPTGFSYLKRDLVRLLGILCQGAKAVQNRVRICGGIPVVMNLCVVDERNPYLREHAIFTLHNLLEGNSENQAIVDSIKPTATWDDEGTLQDGSTS